MIKHIVLMNWIESISEEEIEKVSKSLSDLVSEIPEIKSYIHGKDHKIFKNNADYAIVAEFENETDFKKYVFHEKHKSLIEYLISPRLATYQSIQLAC